MFKRLAITLALVASTLVGFSALAPSAGAVAYTPPPCASQRTLDRGWYLSKQPGYSYHMVEDDYYAYTVNNWCTYTSHVAVDTCNQYGCYRATFEAWLPYWAEVSTVGNYSARITIITPFVGAWGSEEGVFSTGSNRGSGAWGAVVYGTPQYGSPYGNPTPDGSEWEQVFHAWPSLEYNAAKDDYYTLIGL